MKRIWGTLVNDVRLQWRNGFYYATAVMLALFAILLSQAPRADLRFLLPVVIVNNIMINGFYFVAGLVLLEKSEGSLQAQVITPLRPAEYLAGKVLSLTLLSVIENGLLALLVMPDAISIGWLLWGVAAGVCFFTLAGLVVVVRYEAVNEFLLPSLCVATLLALPLGPYFGVGDTAVSATLVYLHPLQAILLALRAGAEGAGAETVLAGWQALYVVVYAVLFCSVAFLLAERAYERFVHQTTLSSKRKERRIDAP